MSEEKYRTLFSQASDAIFIMNEDIFIDPTCMDNMDECQFVIYRYETDLSTIKSDGRYKNLDKIGKKEDLDSVPMLIYIA